MVTIPSATVLTSPVINFTRASRRRVDVPLEVSPGADLEATRQIVLDAIWAAPGVDYDLGLKACEELRSLVPDKATMAQLALRWILMFDAVTCAIPGAKRPAQAEDNIRAVELPPLSQAAMQRVREVYDHYLRPQVHALW